jgi:hypothetical protein
MRGKPLKFIVLSLILLSASLIHSPLVLSQSTSVVIIAGESKSGSFSLSNPSVFYYKRVVLREAWVESENGTLVRGFNVTLFPKVVNGWAPKQEVEFWYNISAPKNVSPGEYVLKILFLGVLQDNSINRFTLSVPLKVLGSPIVVGGITVHPEREVLIGSNLVVYLPLRNIGSENVSLNTTLSIMKDGKPYYIERREVAIPPGNSSVVFEVPITPKFEEGDYNVTVDVGYRGETKKLTSSVHVSLGVEFFSVSLEKDRFYPNEEGAVYVTVVSKREGSSRLYVYTYRNGTSVDVRTIGVTLSPGTQVVKVPLVTNSSGSYVVKLKLVVNGVVAGSSELSYLVVGPPRISNVTIVREGMNVTFLLGIVNEGSSGQGVLRYQFTLGGKSLLSGSKVINVPSGRGTVSFNLSVPESGLLTYRFVLEFKGFTSKSEGQVVIPSVVATSTSSSKPIQSSTAPPSPTPSPTTSPEERGGNRGPLLVLLGLILAVIIAWYYEESKKSKRRVRPKPKRRSPLGRFRRPKRPSFKEKESLPKK